MTRDRLTELARRIESQPWNKPGADKTWLLNAMWQQRDFQREVAKARRGAPR